MSVDLDEVPLTFGKYKGKTPNEVGHYSPSYVVWMYDNIEQKHCTKALRDLCEQDVREDEENWKDELYNGFEF